MPEAKISVRLDVKGGNLKKGAEDAADAFAKRIANDLVKLLKNLNINLGGDNKSGSSGISSSLLKLVGLTSIMTAGIGLISSAVMDFAPIVGIFKLLKTIITILLIPLIPILRPVLVALGAMAKDLLPVMNKVSKWVEKAVKLFDMSGLNVSDKIWDMLVKSWNWQLDFGEKVWGWLKTAWTWGLDIAGKAWELFKAGWTWELNLAGKIWDKLLATWTWTLDLGGLIWDWVKSKLTGAPMPANVSSDVHSSSSSSTGLIMPYSGTSSAAAQAAQTISSTLNSIASVFSAVGISNSVTQVASTLSSRSVHDAIITPSGVVHTDPNDFIVATKNPSSLGSSSRGGNKYYFNVPAYSLSEVERTVRNSARASEFDIRRRSFI